MGSNIDHKKFIREAIQLSKQAVENGNEPFGALLVEDGKVFLKAENTIFTDHDCTRHAELNLISLGSRIFSSKTIAECTLYTSTEPCAMCAGAIYWSGISKVVFACSDETLAKWAGKDFLTPCRDIFALGKRKIEVIGPLLEQEAEVHHQNYWE